MRFRPSPSDLKNLLGPGICRNPRESAKKSPLLRKSAAAIGIFMCLVSSVALSCPYSIRDVGFVDLDPSPYRLYCFLRDDTSNREIAASTFERVSRAALADCNVRVEIVNVDRQQTHPAAEYVRFWEIKAFPAAILVSPRGQSMVLPMVQPQRRFEETVWSLVEKVVSSPRREELMANIAETWCVALLVEGKDVAENARARDVVRDAIGAIARTMDQAEKTVERGPYLIVLSPKSFAEEEILLWCLALEQHESRGPRVAVLTGRGRQMGPVLEGETLRKDSLFYILSIVGMKCGCDVAPSRLWGPQIPLRWSEKVRSEVAKHLGFDPDNPMVRMEVGQVWSTTWQSGDDASGPFAYSEGEIASREGSFESGKAPAPATHLTVSGPQGRVPLEHAVAPKAPPTLGTRVGRAALLVGAGMVFCALMGSALIISRARQKKPSS